VEEIPELSAEATSEATEVASADVREIALERWHPDGRTEECQVVADPGHHGSRAVERRGTEAGGSRALGDPAIMEAEPQAQRRGIDMDEPGDVLQCYFPLIRPARDGAGSAPQSGLELPSRLLGIRRAPPLGASLFDLRLRLGYGRQAGEMLCVTALLRWRGIDERRRIQDDQQGDEIRSFFSGPGASRRRTPAPSADGRIPAGSRGRCSPWATPGHRLPLSVSDGMAVGLPASAPEPG